MGQETPPPFFEWLIVFPPGGGENGGDGIKPANFYFRRMDASFQTEVVEACGEPVPRFRIVVLGKKGLHGGGQIAFGFAWDGRKMRVDQQNIPRSEDRAEDAGGNIRRQIGRKAEKGDQSRRKGYRDHGA